MSEARYSPTCALFLTRPWEGGDIMVIEKSWSPHASRYIHTLAFCNHHPPSVGGSLMLAPYSLCWVIIERWFFSGNFLPEPLPKKSFSNKRQSSECHALENTTCYCLCHILPKQFFPASLGPLVVFWWTQGVASVLLAGSEVHWSVWW